MRTASLFIFSPAVPLPVEINQLVAEYGALRVSVLLP